MTWPNYIIALLCFALLLTNPIFAQTSRDSLQTKVRDPQLRKELLGMEVNDQNVEHLFAETMSRHPSDSIALTNAGRKMDSVFNRNTTALKEIMRRYGWPDINQVGRKGAQAAFLIVQHSLDTLFQRSCLPLLRIAYEHGQTSGDYLALLTDRVLVREGKPQLYGTQAKLVGRRIVIDPISDSVNVDARRAKLGLPPLAQYMKLLKQVYQPKGK